MSKLDGIKAGDRVRVTFEAEVLSEVDGMGDLKIAYDGCDKPYDFDWILSRITAAPTFQITRLDPPLKLGDRVYILGGVKVGDIVAFLSDGRAVCEYEAGEVTSVHAYDISCLSRA